MREQNIFIADMEEVSLVWLENQFNHNITLKV